MNSTQDKESVHRIVYISRAAPDLDEDAVEELVQRARVKNAKLEITGALLFERDHFFQILEGRREDVQGLFETITVDPRHSDVQLLIDDDLESHQFTVWSLAWNRVNDHVISESFEELKEAVASPAPREDLGMIHKFLIMLHGFLPKVD